MLESERPLNTPLSLRVLGGLGFGTGSLSQANSRLYQSFSIS